MTVSELQELFLGIYKEFDRKGYFQEYFGYYCSDQVEAYEGVVTSLDHIGDYIFRKLRKKYLWPIEINIVQYDEVDVFDMVEFFFEHISKPIITDNDYHYGWECGPHYHLFDKEAGEREYIESINGILNDYKKGYELAENGEIYSLAQEEYRSLVKANLPESVDANIASRVTNAVKLFRKYGSTLDDRRNAIKEFADILEFFRKEIEKGDFFTKKDESDLFNILNNFEIRHLNNKQKTNYDKNIWLSWMFYFYLATIHALSRYLKKYEM